MVKKIAKAILPPFIHATLRGILYGNKSLYHPVWHTINSGILRGRQIFIDPKIGLALQGMIDGNHDDFIFKYLSGMRLKGKVIFDIGAWVGYHSMHFASMVGDNGLVYAFEPNLFNRERMVINLDKNADLKKRIKIIDVAISDSKGLVDFYLDRNVDSGASSGSFVGDAHTCHPKSVTYLKRFEKASIRAVTLDSVSELIGDIKPHVIKIDVEGAEGNVLQGGIGLLKRHKPLIIIEIHSAYNMLISDRILGAANYEVALLKEEVDGRCFIVAKSKDNSCFRDNYE